MICCNRVSIKYFYLTLIRTKKISLIACAKPRYGVSFVSTGGFPTQRASDREREMCSSHYDIMEKWHDALNLLTRTIKCHHFRSWANALKTHWRSNFSLVLVGKDFICKRHLSFENWYTMQSKWSCLLGLSDHQKHNLWLNNAPRCFFLCCPIKLETLKPSSILREFIRSVRLSITACDCYWIGTLWGNLSLDSIV